MIFDKLKQYKNSNQFRFKANENLREKCNAPKDKSGIYVVYAIKNGIEELIYIGSSGKMGKNGKIKHRKGGLYDRIVNGKQFDKPRRISWSQKMEEDHIDELIIHWYNTFDKEYTDIPLYVEAVLIQQYFNRFKRLPAWNEEF